MLGREEVGLRWGAKLVQCELRLRHGLLSDGYVVGTWVPELLERSLGLINRNLRRLDIAGAWVAELVKACLGLCDCLLLQANFPIRRTLSLQLGEIILLGLQRNLGGQHRGICFGLSDCRSPGRRRSLTSTRTLYVDLRALNLEDRIGDVLWLRLGGIQDLS